MNLFLRSSCKEALSRSPDIGAAIYVSTGATGVISNFVLNDEGHDVCLVLTDARCLPCSEGGPVVDEAGSLVGVVLPPLAQRNGQTVGYALVAPMAAVRPFLEQCDLQPLTLHLDSRLATLYSFHF